MLLWADNEGGEDEINGHIVTHKPRIRVDLRYEPREMVGSSGWSGEVDGNEHSYRYPVIDLELIQRQGPGSYSAANLRPTWYTAHAGTQIPGYKKPLCLT
jgi:hypothetical protein